MSTKTAWILIAACSLVPVRAARAGASLYVDDAGIVAPGHCQLESWLRASAPGREFSAVPACHVAGTELGLGLSDYAEPAQARVAAFGAKRVLHEASSQRWALAASLGANWNASRGAFDGWNFNLPLSFAADAAQRRRWHFNLGWSAPRHGRDALTAGIGLEQALDSRWSALAEVFADHRGDRIAQLGLRCEIDAARSLDVLIGQRDGDARSPWLTLGFNLLLPR
ncbi:MAG: hypothetical protein ACREP7_21935 [Lysobacter sp.]